MDDSLDTNATLLNNWPSSMTSNGGRFVDGEDDLFDRDDELDGILDPDSEAREEIQVLVKIIFFCFSVLFLVIHKYILK